MCATLLLQLALVIPAFSAFTRCRWSSTGLPLVCMHESTVADLARPADHVTGCIAARPAPYASLVFCTAVRLRQLGTVMASGMRTHADVQGNCADAPPAEEVMDGEDGSVELLPLLPVKPLQCLVLVGDSALQFLSGTKWLDNLYFRLQKTRADPGFVLLQLGWHAPRDPDQVLSKEPEATLYMTNVTVQGQVRGVSDVLASQRASNTLAEGAVCWACCLWPHPGDAWTDECLGGCAVVHHHCNGPQAAR